LRQHAEQELERRLNPPQQRSLPEGGAACHAENGPAGEPPAETRFIG